MSPLELADRIAALDWSGTSLQHQLAMAAAVETLRGRREESGCDNPVREMVSLLEDLLGRSSRAGRVGASSQMERAAKDSEINC